MPLREEDSLDYGFNAYPAPLAPAERPKEPDNPLLAIGKLASAAVSPILAGRYYQEEGETIAAGMRIENDVYNAVSLLTRPVFPPDPSFDLVSRLKADGLWEDYSQNFIGVESEAEYLSVSGRISQEEKDRRTLASAGTAGLIAQMAAGIISPTMLLPFVGEARGARAVAFGAGMGFVGGAAQEIPLQLAQETRSMGESVSSIALSTVIGGVLGSAVAFARRGPVEIAREIEDSGMALAPRAEAISPPRPASAGAAAVDVNIELAPFASRGVEDTAARISPITRVLTSSLEQGRSMMARLADAGLEFKNSAVGMPGGNVESRIKTYYGPVEASFRFTDDAFNRYYFRTTGRGGAFLGARARLAGLNPNRTHLSRSEFRAAVSDAMRNGDQHAIPEVAETAKFFREKIFDPLGKLGEEAGLFKLAEDGETPGDKSYLTRVYNLDVIEKRQGEFEKILANHYEQKLVDEFRAAWTKLGERQARGEEKIADFGRSPDEVKALREQFESDLKALEEGRDEELVNLEDAISDKRSAMRSFDRGTPEWKAARAEAQALEQEGGEALAQTRETRATIRRRLANLRRAHSALTERQQKKLDKIARSEELSFGTLQRLIRKGQKVLADFDRLSDDALDSELSKLRNQFADAAARFDRNEERIAKVFDDEFEADKPTSPFLQAARVESESFDKMTQVADALGELDEFDRVAAREAVQAALDDATRRAQGIVQRRAVRAARLAEQAEGLSPEAATKRISDLQEEMKLGQQEFLDNWRAKGADDIDPVTGTAAFRNHAMEMARQTTNKILGTYARLPGMDMLAEARGAELARVLDIDSRLLRDPRDGLSFLEDDVEKVAMIYTRTLAPDIELSRAFGPDFLGKRAEGTQELNENWKKLDDEYNGRREALVSQMEAGVNPKTGKPKEYSQKDIDKAVGELNAEYRAVRRDLEATIARLRHTWGVPKDPRGFAARAAKVAADTNVLRFMNMVTFSSIPDIGRPIQKYGLLRTFREGWVPFLKGLGELKLTARQLRIAGAANDVFLHTRAGSLYDIGDYMVRGSKFEKGLEYATSKIGLLAVFDYWTTAMKQITGSITVARASDALSVVAGGAKASKADLDEAVRFLAANGIDDDYARRIWKQFENGGGEEVGGQWWPNTEDWTDQDAARAFNAMLVREVDNTIITPGVERPLVADANPFTKLLFQFKSFGMSSNTKTVIAGMQSMRQGDMAFLMGGLISLALGAISYYTSAMIAGGTTRERMLKAFSEGDFSKITDEAIDRSGLLGSAADVRSAFMATPLAPYISFSGERSTRRGGDNLMETLYGPTYGDLIPKVLSTGAGLAGVAESALSTHELSLGEVPWNDVRRLAPWQNHFLFRHLYDQVEAAMGSLPERRE